jgi:hypothetical protein
MKKYWIEIVVILALFVAVGVGFYGSSKRVKLAAEWASESTLAISTADSLNRTLVISIVTPEDPARDPLRCSLLVGSIVNDSDTVGKFRAAGFTQVQCGKIKVELQ